MMRLSALLLSFATVVVVADKDDWILRKFNRHMVHPLKDATDNLVYVTFSLDDSEAIKLDFQDERKSCVVPHHLAYNSRSRHKLAVLGNGKVVVTMMNNQMSRGAISDAISKLEWKLSIVDPKNCTYRHKVIANAGKVFENIVPYMDTFDLVISEGQVNKVVRYKDDGELEGFSAVIPDKRFLGVRIAKEFDPSQGYYYVVPNRKEGQSIIKKLSSRFEVTRSYVVKRDRLSQNPQSYSMRYGRVTFCYFTAGRTKLECVVIDGELTRELLKIPLKYEQSLSQTTVVNYQQGGFAIVHYHRQENRVSTVYARRVSDTGHVGPVVKIGEVTDAIYHIYGFVMNDGKLCIVVTVEDSALTKCVDLQ